MPDSPSENTVWDHNERLPRSELEQLQLNRLRDTVARVTSVPFYKEAFTPQRITPESIKHLDDIQQLPFTTKDDLRRHYPLGFLAVPREQIARIHGSSGTTGKLTLVAYTAGDRDIWANLCARFLVAGGLREEHLVHIAFGYGLFTGGFGLHYGVEKVGAAVLPVSTGNSSRQLMLLQDLAPEVLICTPSYALQLAETARAKGIDPQALPLRFAHLGAEPWTEKMRETIEEELSLRAFNNYGLSEVIGPGVAGECSFRNGMHIQEDHFLVECIDPDTLQPVGEGEQGELVFTTLTKEALPLIRYRTRDLAILDHSPCPCGRTGVRMSRVIGRTDDMLIIRGVNLFPTQIEEALLKVEGTAPHYLIEVDRPGNLDRLSVYVEMRSKDFSDKMSHMQALRDRIGKEIQAITGLGATVHLVEPQTLERSAGKAVRVVDKRNDT